MKKTDFMSQDFRELTAEENFKCTGGGFAYDVGRFLRFVGIAGPFGQFTPSALADAILVQAL
ncbi:MAG: hypothetical protein KAT15_02255 [Bacteroidales bacterium]|nr:hypothetical protein [Bacteroidales bacterium]